MGRKNSWTRMCVQTTQTDHTLEIRQKNISGAPFQQRDSTSQFKSTCQVHNELIPQGGPVSSPPSVLFFYYQKLQGAWARRARGHGSVTVGERKCVWEQGVGGVTESSVRLSERDRQTDR